LYGEEVKKQILQNKLRLLYPRRPCADINATACGEPDPPHIDAPNGWTGPMDVIHIDFKFPSEHTVEGKRYDGEMQVYSVHPVKKRTMILAVLINATEDGHNYYVDNVVESFQLVYDSHASECARNTQRNRRLKFGTGDEFNEGGATDLSIDRGLQSQAVWDPFHETVVPSIYFWRYDGSLTEPPCGEFVTWTIIDTPMTISFKQLDRMRNFLFNHVDPYCRRTSTQFDHSVARPLQESADRDVWRCTPDDFGPDPVV
jgi:Eukaryotic-type carbonic anhydrase